MNAAALEQEIEQLIRGPQYALPQAKKDARLTAILRELCRDVAARCPPYGRFLDRAGPPWRALAARWPTSRRCRWRCSSGSCSRRSPPERIVRRAALLGHHRPAAQPDRHRQDDGLSAGPGAGRRSSRSTWAAGGGRSWCSTRRSRPARGRAALRPRRRHPRHRQFRLGNRLRHAALAWRRTGAELGRHRRRSSPGIAARRCCCSASPSSSGRGFLLEAERRGRRFQAPRAVLLHSGGWKKLAAQAVSKDEFSRRRARCSARCRGRSSISTAWSSKWARSWSIARPGNKHAPPSPTCSFAAPTRSRRPPGRVRASSRSSARCRPAIPARPC